MAKLSSIQDDIELCFRLIGRSYDPFQVDLEWFDYELAVKVGKAPRCSDPEGDHSQAPRRECDSVSGRINTKDFKDLLACLDELLAEGKDLQFEPYDLNFYLEWTRETEHICLIVSWFDLGLSPRELDHRFPTAHAGFRFLAEDDSLARFRKELEEEFLWPADFQDVAPGARPH
ncbi:MAG TPA: hypothetical protein VLZ81_13560 [Blastocatellia bacterium]|nr:hypothetical protein [Blastocatellia bacterium]